MANYPHNPELTQRVVDCWHSGLSASECAKTCGLPTRNTAMGIISRHKAAGCDKCPTRVSPQVGGGARVATANRAVSPVARAPRSPKAPPVPAVVLAPIGPAGDIPTGCKFIAADFNRNFQMCGRPRTVGAWCAGHAALVYHK